MPLIIASVQACLACSGGKAGRDSVSSAISCGGPARHSIGAAPSATRGSSGYRICRHPPFTAIPRVLDRARIRSPWAVASVTGGRVRAVAGEHPPAPASAQLPPLLRQGDPLQQALGIAGNQPEPTDLVAIPDRQRHQPALLARFQRHALVTTLPWVNPALAARSQLEHLSSLRAVARQPMASLLPSLTAFGGSCSPAGKARGLDRHQLGTLRPKERAFDFAIRIEMREGGAIARQLTQIDRRHLIGARRR
jgi:hypothetical protein